MSNCKFKWLIFFKTKEGQKVRDGPSGEKGKKSSKWLEEFQCLQVKGYLQEESPWNIKMT